MSGSKIAGIPINIFSGLQRREWWLRYGIGGISRQLPEFHLSSDPSAGLSANRPEMWENYQLKMNSRHPVRPIWRPCTHH